MVGVPITITRGAGLGSRAQDTVRFSDQSSRNGIVKNPGLEFWAIGFSRERFFQYPSRLNHSENEPIIVLTVAVLNLPSFQDTETVIVLSPAKGVSF